MAKRPPTKSGRSGRGTPAPLLIRQFHGYLSAFVAPSVLFFAVTGALQLFGLHEAHDGYHPPAVIEKLGRLHKDQVFSLKPHRGAEAKPTAALGDAESSGAGHSHEEGEWVAPAKPTSILPPLEGDARAQALKWLFLGAAITLVASTFLGLWMALAQSRQKPALWVVFLLGVAAPLAILLL